MAQNLLRLIEQAVKKGTSCCLPVPRFDTIAFALLNTPLPIAPLRSALFEKLSLVNVGTLVISKSPKVPKPRRLLIASISWPTCTVIFLGCHCSIAWEIGLSTDSNTLRNELGWTDFRLTDYPSIEWWWEIIFCAYLMVSLHAQRFCWQASESSSDSEWWLHQHSSVSIHTGKMARRGKVLSTICDSCHNSMFVIIDSSLG